MIRLRNIVLAAAVILALTAPVYAGLAPLNPAFVEWRNAQAEKLNASEVRASEASSGTKYKTGAIPSPVDLSHLRDNPPVLAAADEELPVSYDLRTLGRLTPIRQQSPWGTCWDFAATAAVESNYLTHLLNNDGKVDGSLGNAETLDLSELHVAWYIQNNPDKTRLHTGPNVSRIETSLLNIDAGGYNSMPLAYYARLDGPVLEQDLPYLSYEALSNDAGYSPEEWDALSKKKALPSYTELQTLTSIRTDGRVLLPSEDVPADYYSAKLRLTDTLYGTYNPAVGGDSYYTSGDKKYIVGEFVKRLVMEHGAVTAFYFTDDDDSYDRVHHSYYYTGNGYDGSNHVVDIVGWDDNFPRENFLSNDVMPKNNGAWLIRNSWGEFIGSDHGYFWMSYEQPIFEGAAFIVEDMPAGIRVYEYDPLGWCNAFGNGESKTMWAANTFKVKSSGESLESISFYTTDNNATCEWEIYYGMTDKPSGAPYTSGAARVTGSQTYPYAGYHTVKLESPIALTKGQYFAVVIKFTNANHGYPLGVEGKVEYYSDFAVVHDGESWFSDDGIEWEDGTTIEGTERGQDKIVQHIPLNACIKAFTIDTIDDEEAAADENTILGISVKDFDFSGAVDVEKENSGIPDEPIPERLLVLPASKDLDQKFSADTVIAFYLVNMTEAFEFAGSYRVETNTKYPTGAYTPQEVEYDPVFDPGYEPNEFWRADNGVEYPVYGPFIEVVDKNSCISLDVDKLEYVDGSKCSIPKGYYNFIYEEFVLDGGVDFTGSLNLRLSSTTPEDSSDTPENPSTPDTPSNTGTAGSSSGGCEVGVYGVVMLVGLGLVLAGKKRA